jgi:integrase/recombinase XerD
MYRSCDLIEADVEPSGDIEPITVAAYVEQHSGSPATIKQHMSAIRMLFSWLTEKGILAMNPTREVKT